MSAYKTKSTPCDRKAGRAGANALRALAVCTGVAAAVATLAPAYGQGQPVDAGVERQLTTASADGPAALLRALDDVLRANPALASTPARAAALARVAGAPVSGFIGASVPVYRGITDRITAAAPPASAQAVRQAVASELGRMAAADVRPLPPAPAQTTLAPPGAPQLGGPGYRVGSFTIYPDIQSALIFDDNIYATKTSRRSDWLGTISPKLSVESNWERHSLTAEVQTDLTGYARSPHENTVDWNANIEGRIDASQQTQILLGATAIASHEDRSSPDAVNGITPTPYMESNGYAGVIHRYGDFSIRLGGAIEHLTFSNVDGANGIINNQDRNRTRYTFGTLVRYEANPAFRPFVELLGDIRRYNSRYDDFGYARSSDGYRVSAGALFRISTSVRGDFSVGVMSRNAEDSRFKTTTTPSFDGSLRWQATSGTALILYTDRSMEETTLSGSPGYIYTVVGGRVEQRLTQDLTGIARVAWGRSDFIQATRVDNDADMSVGLRYRLTPKVTLGVDYRYTLRDSNVTLARYDRNEVYFRLGSQF